MLCIGNFTCLEVVFKFKRRLGYYLFHTYLPTCLIVIMSWISFWIKPEAVPARYQDKQYTNKKILNRPNNATKTKKYTILFITKYSFQTKLFKILFFLGFLNLMHENVGLMNN